MWPVLTDGAGVLQPAYMHIYTCRMAEDGSVPGAAEISKHCRK